MKLLLPIFFKKTCQDAILINYNFKVSFQELKMIENKSVSLCCVKAFGNRLENMCWSMKTDSYGHNGEVQTHP